LVRALRFCPILSSQMKKEPLPQAPSPEKKLPVRVFIVDDHPIFAEVLAQLLNQSGDFTVVGMANDGETALKRLQGLAVDIIILDLILPGMGGLEVMETLRDNRSEARLVICSGLGTDKIIMEALSRGVSAFVEKSMAVEDLLATLRAVAKGDFPLNSRISGLLRDFVRQRTSAKPLVAGDMLILRRLATGQALKEIAEELGISASGVYKARTRIKSRMNIKGHAGLFQAAMSLGLIYHFEAPVVQPEPGLDGSEETGLS
jgi:DNA-binding NarL/FixJ family response regulator